MKRTDAKQQEKTYLYDRLGRLTQSTDHNGNIMQTIYDTQKAGLVSEVSLTTGAGSTDYLAHKIAYDYDQLLRVQSKTELINGQDYTYSYQYDDLGRTKYMTYPTGLKIRNKYNAKGFLKEILDANSTKSIWKVNADGYDKLGRLIGYMVNNNNGQAITTTKAFDEQTGLLTDIDTYSNSQQVQNLHYNYDILGNMSSRSQSTVDALAETFNYDALNRLTDATTRINGSINNTINYNYAANGNIQNISNLGSFTYAETPNAGPYAISGVDFDNGVDMPQPQNISYTTFDKEIPFQFHNYWYYADVEAMLIYECNEIYQQICFTIGIKSLTETGIGSLVIKYGLDQQRLYQTSTLENGTTKEKYFIGGLYEKEISEGVIKELCYISTPAGTIAIKETQDNVDNWLFLTHDHLGSVHCILNENGDLEQELSFDPYGNRRDPNTWKPFEDGTEPTYIIDRGYTFHEHWDDFGLINMNGRVYDPVIARFLSPDPYVQSPGYSQNFNRYSYVLNNPLKYTDPSGELIGWNDAVVAGVGFAYGYLSYGIMNDDWGGKAVANGGINAALFEFGYLTMGGGLAAGGSVSVTGSYLGSTAINIAASSVMPSFQLFQNDNWSFSVSPTVSLNGMGVGLNAGYTNGDWTISGSASIGGHNGGMESRVSGGVSYFDDLNKLGFSVGATKYGINDPQSNWFGGLRIGKDFSFSMTNDVKISPGDKYRTAAAEIGIGDFSFGFIVYTTEHGSKMDGEFESKIWGKHKYGLGAYTEGRRIASPAYIGYRNNGLEYRFGVDSPWVQDATQNWKHHSMRKTPYFETDYYTPAKPYMFLSSYNPFSLY